MHARWRVRVLLVTTRRHHFVAIGRTDVRDVQDTFLDFTRKCTFP